MAIITITVAPDEPPHRVTVFEPNAEGNVTGTEETLAPGDERQITVTASRSVAIDITGA